MKFSQSVADARLLLVARWSGSAALHNCRAAQMLAAQWLRTWETALLAMARGRRRERCDMEASSYVKERS
jgi:hypothetical protein